MPELPPILYSFRRCPYAMRARMALYVSAQQIELREVKLSDKPDAFLQASASASVPCLVTADGAIDESLDIMIWALKRRDPEGWLEMPDDGWAWIRRADGPFKSALDRTKYATRYPDSDPVQARAQAVAFLGDLDAQLDGWLYARATLADHALLPFVRQFAFIDKPWFDAQPWPRLQAWLEAFLTSTAFAAIMSKQTPWQPGADPQIAFV